MLNQVRHSLRYFMPYPVSNNLTTDTSCLPRSTPERPVGLIGA